MGTGFSKKKKQAKQLQDQFMQLQNQMKNVEVEGSAGNGLVTLRLNGENQLLSIKIQPDCVDPEDTEGLEDLIKAAHQDALEKLQKQSLPQLPDLGAGFPF